MAQSPENVEERLERLETSMREVKRALTQVVVLVTERSEQLDAGFRRLWDEIRTDRERIDRLDDHMDGMNRRLNGLDARMDGMNQRLDRLIAITLQERTERAERLAKIEERLDKLEARWGGWRRGAHGRALSS